MKKTIIIITTFFTAYTLKAQNVHFGIKAGMNASSLNSSSSNSDMQTKIGFNAGILAHIHTENPRWSLQPEIYFSDEGAKSKSNSDAKLNIGFLNIPILAQYMFENGFRIEGGPQVGFLLSAKSKLNSTSTDVKGLYKKINFSIPVGAGYLTRTGLGFDARYNFGASDINNTSSGTKLHSNVFQFGIFYQFTDSRIK